MTKDEALKLLRAGQEGVYKWNSLRDNGEEIPSLGGAKLDGFDLRCFDLRRVDLTDADLAGARVDVNTQFYAAQVEGCIIDRHALESLKDGDGGLTAGQRMDMKIRDGVATLRTSYSGFLQWIHLTALVVFVFPYVYFVLKLWASAQFNLSDSDNKITLFRALGRFIATGGENLQDGWHLKFWPLFIFIQALFYNVLRGFLLWKTKSLELAQDASGLPQRFSLTEDWKWFSRPRIWSWFRMPGKWKWFWQQEVRWDVMYWMAKIWFVFNLVFVAFNTYHFLQQVVDESKLPGAAQSEVTEPQMVVPRD